MLMDTGGFTTRYKIWLLGLLLAIYTSNFIDRIIIASIGQAIRQDLHLSGLQLGLLGGIAFALFYSVLAIPIARIAERRSRIGVITAATLLWSVMTALCGSAISFWQLLLFRVGVGVGEAGLTPSTYSLLSDHFPPQRRASAIAIFNLGVPLGSLLGAAAGGWAAQHFGWRAAFLLVGIPGVMLALVARGTLRDPPRGYSDSNRGSEATPSLMSVLRTLARKKAFLHITAACFLTAFANFGINLFIPSFFSRGHGLSLSQAGLLFGTLTGASGIIGTVIGGFGTDRAARRDPRWAMWLPCCALLLGAPLYIFAVWQRQLTLAFPLMILSSIAFYVWSPAANGSVQNMVEPRMRASAAALLSLLVNTLGTGCGPVFVGYLSDRYAQHLFAAGTFATECPGGIAASHAAAPLIQACQTAAAGSIRLAITTTAGVYVWAALHFLLASRSLVQDLRSRSTVPSAA